MARKWFHDFKFFVRELLVRILFYSGALWLIAAARMRGRIVVLTYHRVMPPEELSRSHSTLAIVITPRVFERHMRFLKRRFTVLTVQQFQEVLEGRVPIPRRACLVTFDDGWADNFEHALPVLARTGVPATVFAATGFVGTTSCFWQEEITRLIHAAAAAGLSWVDALPAEARPASAARGALDAGYVRRIVDQLKKRPTEEVRASLEKLKGLLAQGAGRVDPGPDRFMSWEQLVALGHSPQITVGSHAHSHVPFTRLQPDELRVELAQSRKILEQHLRSPVPWIAYPNGDHDDTAIRLTREAGYVLGFTTLTGLNRPGDDPLRLKRINIYERGTTSPGGLLSRLLGVM